MEWSVAPESACPDCGAEGQTAVKDGDVLCTNCGLVLDDHVIDDRAEWRTFEGEEDVGNRVGGATDLDTALLLGRQCLNTCIGRAQGGGTAAVPPPAASPSSVSVSAGASHIHRTQRRVECSDGDRLVRTDVQAMGGMIQASDMHLVQDSRNAAMRMFAAFRRKHVVIKDVSKRSCMAVCLLYGSRVNCPKSLGDVMRAFGVTKPNFTSARKLVNDTIKNDVDMRREFYRLSHGMGGDCRDGIKRVVCAVVPQSQRWPVQKRCFFLDDFAKRHNLVGSNDPERYTVALVMVACQDVGVKGIGEQVMTMSFDISLGTLRKHVRTLRETLEREHANERVADAGGPSATTTAASPVESTVYQGA